MTAKAPVRKAVKKPAAKKAPVKKAPAKKKKAKRVPAKKKAGAKSPARKKSAARAKPKKSLRDLRKDFRQKVGGKKAVIQAVKDPEGVIKVIIPTGSMTLDGLLKPEWSDTGGIPSGGITEIVGEQHIGKSTISDHIMTNCQRLGGIAVLLETDAERDWFYSRKCGLNIDDLERVEFLDPEERTLENVMDIAIETTRFWRAEAHDVPVVIVLDALGVTPTSQEVAAGKPMPGDAARILRRACRRISALLSGSSVAFVILNHEYESIGPGVKTRKAYGGEAVGLLALVRLRLHRIMDGWLKRTKDGERLGRKIGADLTKFKRGHANRQCHIPILTGFGIDNTWSIYESLVKRQIIQVSGNGSWAAINLDGEVLKFQGAWGLRDKCLEHPDLFGKLVQVYRSV